MIKNDNKTEWSPIRSEIIRMINKIGSREAGVRFVNHEYDYDRIGWHEVLLPINYNSYNFREKKYIWDKHLLKGQRLKQKIWKFPSFLFGVSGCCHGYCD